MVVAAGLDSLPVESVVRDSRGVIWVHAEGQNDWTRWHGTNGARVSSQGLLKNAPIVALWIPEPEPPRVGDVVHGTVIDVTDLDDRLSLVAIRTPEGEVRNIKVRRNSRHQTA